MTALHKIKSIEELASIVRHEQAMGRKVVHCHGVYDLLHIGHIRHFHQARQFGDLLVVTLSPDRFVDKGLGRTAFPESLRAEALASLKDVDYVAVNQWPTAEETLRLLRPDFYAKGDEFKGIETDPTGKMALEAAVVREVGARLVFTSDIVFSSSNLINRYLSHFSAEQQDYLNLFRARHPLPEVLGALEAMADLRVLVLGDVILDEYQYCQAIGKASKDPILALQYQSEELHAGGVLAVANHLAGFASRVDLVAVLGARDSNEAFIREQLRGNVRAEFVLKPEAPTTLKRRFLDSETLQKVMELYVMDDRLLPEALDLPLCRRVAELAAEADLVVVADFGHGTISPAMVRTLCDSGAYLAVNTQANAGNRGFNTIGKYPRCDFFSLAEHELRLETRDQTAPLRPQLTALAERQQAGHAVVTQGRMGCVVHARGGSTVKTPSFACKVVDRIGAGDALFAVSALAARSGLSVDMVGLLGSMAGALAVEVLGNQRSVEKMALKKALTAVLK